MLVPAALEAKPRQESTWPLAQARVASAIARLTIPSLAPAPFKYLNASCQ